MTGRVVLVTGSTSGIGLATAQRFLDAGDTVILNSVRSIAEGEQLAATITNAHYIQGDVSLPGDRKRVIDGVLEIGGGLDILVNNAGTTKVIPHNDLEAANVDVWREIFEVNLFGTWELSVAAMPALKERRGSIVNVTSIAGVRPNRLIHSLRHLEGCLESLDGVAREGRWSRRARERGGAGSH